MLSTRIMVTGGTGFIGSFFCNNLVRRGGFAITVPVRRSSSRLLPPVKQVFIGGLDGETDWNSLCNKTDCIVHMAGLAHVKQGSGSSALAVFREVNVEGTLRLAKEAALAGVRRFIFISSIGVNGSITSRPFTEEDVPQPSTPYAISKLEAEVGLRELAARTDMEVVIIRPPLVYGPNAPGNFGRLVAAVRSGVPLPLGAINNRRSLVSVHNLADFIVSCISHPAAANQTFIVSDGEDISTRSLIESIGLVVGRKARLFPVPAKMLLAVGGLVGRRAMLEQLCGNLQLDSSKAKQKIGWSPPLTVMQSLRKITLAASE